MDFALFCPQRNIDVECDGDTWHITPIAAAHDNARNNFMEQRGWHVLRFGTFWHSLPTVPADRPQVSNAFVVRIWRPSVESWSGSRDRAQRGCVRSVTTLINRCGGLIPSDDSVKAIAETRPDGWKQGRLL